MSINILDSFNYKGRRPDFVRQQFGTIEAMRTFSENYLPDMYLCYCLEDGKVYLYNKDNAVDQTTGRWRQLESGGGGGDMTNYYTKTETNTLLAGKQDVLEYDSVPTFGSTKVMTSNAIATALTGKMNVEIRDNTPTAGSTQIVTSGGVYTEFQRVGEEQRKQDTTLNFLANNTVKNIINTSVTSFTHRGITYTVGNDGKISINGTLDSRYDGSYCWVIGGVQGYNNDTPYSQQVPIPKGVYALTMSGGSASTYYAILGYRNAENGNRIVKYIYDGEVTFEIMYDTGRYDLAIYCVTTQANYSATADLMLRPVSIADSSYRPYAPTNKELYDLVRGKQDALTVDSTPTSGSSNPVTSGGVYTALSGKQATLTFDSTPTANSNNPVKSQGVKAYVDAETTARQAECGAVANLGAKNMCPYNSFSATATSGTGATPVNDQPINLPAGTYILTYTQTATTGASSIRFSYNGTSVLNFTINNDSTLTKEKEFTLASAANQIKVFSNAINNYSNFMIRPKAISDDTYVPYAPTNKELKELNDSKITMLNILGAGQRIEATEEAPLSFDDTPFTSVGRFNWLSGSTAYITNCPTYIGGVAKGGLLEVSYIQGSSTVLQTAYPSAGADSPSIFWQRFRYGAGTTANPYRWTNWYAFTGTEVVPPSAQTTNLGGEMRSVAPSLEESDVEKPVELQEDEMR